MTSKRLATAVAGASVLLMAAAPLAAALAPPRAHKHSTAPRRRSAALSGCRISLLAEPRRVTSGDETPQLFGRLACVRGGETAGQTVTVYARTAGHLATVLGTSTSTSGGFYSFVAPAPTLDTAYYAAAAGATSSSRTVRVEPQVTLSGPSESKALFTGARNRVTFAGTVSAADVGARVLLQREAASAYEEWVPIQTGVVGAGGAYSLIHTFAVPGVANIRVVVRSHGLYTVSGASSPLSYVISQKENPLLTLFASGTGVSSDPITYGQSVTLEGAVAGGANKTVTLLARTARGAFVTVASQLAGPAGQYKFLIAPQQDTGYRVLAASGTHSAVLFEGVKSVLTAAASASALQDGQTLTFTGSVTPYDPGHVIYLERQNSPGSGSFHVVAVATPTAAHAGEDAGYTLSHTVFGIGKQVYRVKVPGNPSDEGNASPPFTVEVTPAPASALAPGLPGEP